MKTSYPNRSQGESGVPVRIDILGGQGAIATMHAALRLTQRLAQHFKYTKDEQYPHIHIVSSGTSYVNVQGNVQGQWDLTKHVDGQSRQLMILPCNSLECTLPWSVQGVMVLNPWRSAQKYLDRKEHVILGSQALMQRAQEEGFCIPPKGSALYETIQYCIEQVIQGHNLREVGLKLRAAVACHPWSCTQPRQVVLACTELSALSVYYPDTLDWMLEDVCQWMSMNMGSYKR